MTWFNLTRTCFSLIMFYLNQYTCKTLETKFRGDPLSGPQLMGLKKMKCTQQKIAKFLYVTQSLRYRYNLKGSKYRPSMMIKFYVMLPI